jgi:hypothetical protein
MRACRWSVPFILALFVLVPGVSADEGEGGPATAGVAERALEVLELRMEARLKEGALLGGAGRTEEALEAYRSVGEIYERGMERIRELVGQVAAASDGPAAAPTTVPIDAVPIDAGPGGKTGAKRQYQDRVDDALSWLHAHQSPDGSWEAAGFSGWCDGKAADAARRPDGLGKSLYTPGVTGLALAAFLGAGYTNRGKHPFAQVVSKGLRYLKKIQDAHGCFGPRSTQQYMYNHAICALVMVESYGMTGSPIFEASAQRALDFIATSRNPYMAWRYGVRPGDNDTSVTSWMTMALKSAMVINEAAIARGRPAPLTLDESAFDGVKAWLDKVTDPDYGRVGYIQRGSGPARPADLIDRFPAAKSEAMTASGILMRILMGEDPGRSRAIQLGADLLAKLPPVWNPSDGSIDMYYWYYGTLAMFQVDGEGWKQWNHAIKDAIVDHQRTDGDERGSWDPVGPWGREGGRVYSTALNTMCMEVYFRYPKVFGTGKGR